jgi:hypothetical protein
MHRATFEHWLTDMLPCDECHVAYPQHLREYPVHEVVARQAELARWTVVIHNVVNRKLDKPAVTDMAQVARNIEQWLTCWTANFTYMLLAASNVERTGRLVPRFIEHVYRMARASWDTVNESDHRLSKTQRVFIISYLATLVRAFHDLTEPMAIKERLYEYAVRQEERYKQCFMPISLRNTL